MDLLRRFGHLALGVGRLESHHLGRGAAKRHAPITRDTRRYPAMKSNEHIQVDWRSRQLLLVYAILPFAFAFATYLLTRFLYYDAAKEWDVPGWYIAGVLIGAIYVFVTACYFYEKFVVPHRRAAQGPHSIYSNIYIWMVQWCTPALWVQAFVILGFCITIDRAPFQPGVYTHPYMYGKVYAEYVDPRLDQAARAPVLDQARQYLDPKKFESGPEGKVPDGEVEGAIYKIPFLIALAFSFLGTLIYTLRDIALRFYTSDLYSKTLVGYVIRFLFAPIVCLVIAYSLSERWPSALAPLLFFAIGLLPQRWIQYIFEITRRYTGLKKRRGNELSLDQIAGMTEYMAYRFDEIGISDAQNLAYVDLRYLRSNVGMGYGDRLLCDFVAQAILLVHLKEDFAKLQGYGIRDIVSFENVVKVGNYVELARTMGMAPEKFRALLHVCADEAMRTRVAELRRCYQHHLPEGDIREFIPQTVMAG